MSYVLRTQDRPKQVQTCKSLAKKYAFYFLLGVGQKVILGFIRMGLGEGIKKKSEDFANEVDSLIS